MTTTDKIFGQLLPITASSVEDEHADLQRQAGLPSAFVIK